MCLTNLVGINEEVGTVIMSNDSKCKARKCHLSKLYNGWSANSDFDDEAFTLVRLSHGEPEVPIELNFRENLVRITSESLDPSPDQKLSITSDVANGMGPAESDLALADYSGDWLEIWFRNECREVAGLTHWGAYSYGRWWKGVAVQYDIPEASQVRLVKGSLPLALP